MMGLDPDLYGCVFVQRNLQINFCIFDQKILKEPALYSSYTHYFFMFLHACVRACVCVCIYHMHGHATSTFPMTSFKYDDKIKMERDVRLFIGQSVFG